MKLINIKNGKEILVSIVIMFLVGFNSLPAAEYLLQQGDKVDISVWGDENLSRELKILPDGSISFPLAGRVIVAGRTSSQVENIIKIKLKKYLTDPEVTVIVTGTDGSKVYVLGKVNKPGPILLSGPLTVLQALSIAGGFDKFADLDSIKIIRNTSQGHKVLPVDYNNLLNGEELDTNYLLATYDTILVP